MSQLLRQVATTQVHAMKAFQNLAKLASNKTPKAALRSFQEQFRRFLAANNMFL